MQLARKKEDVHESKPLMSGRECTLGPSFDRGVFTWKTGILQQGRGQIRGSGAAGKKKLPGTRMCTRTEDFSINEKEQGM